jgi:three-Cys-motif partner protein
MHMLLCTAFAFEPLSKRELARMTADTFFTNQSPESAAKTDIVANFFAAWLNIIGAVTTYRGPLAYMELFAGPGKFADNTISTPIRVLDVILASPHASRFRVILNEMNPRAADLLRQNIDILPGIDRLYDRPILTREEIDQENALLFLKNLADFPAVLFVDPFGYKGVSRQFFAEFMSAGWGRDAILFFNYKRINAALSNPEFDEHMTAMFGEDRARLLRDELDRLHPHQREQRVHAEIENALHEVGVKFVQRYDFEKRHDSLFFMSQKEKGLRVMKSVMQKRSTSDDHGVPSFSYARPQDSQTSFSMFAPARTPIDELRDDLLARFAGRTLTFEQIVSEHHPGTNYIDKNYRQALLELETREEISTYPKLRRAGTFGPSVRVTFPKRG